MSAAPQLSQQPELPSLTHGIQLEIGPFLVRVRSELPALLQHLRLLYSDFPASADEGCHFDVAVVGGHGLHRWVRPQAVLSVNGARPYLPLPADLAGPVLEWGLNYCIGTRVHHLVTVHAAVVERDGKALILSAPSGSGKSTLCAALAYSGWRLFSDEFALLDPSLGCLWPAPRPVSLKQAAIEIIRRRHPDVVYGPEKVDMEGLRFVHARPPSDSVRRSHEPAVPGWIVLPRYSPGSPTNFEPVSKAQALMELAGQSFNYNYLSNGFESLARLVEQSQCYALEYSDLDDVLSRFAELR